MLDRFARPARYPERCCGIVRHGVVLVEMLSGESL
jgi:hypothetical protein